VPPVPVELDEDAFERLRDAVIDCMHVQLSAVTADEFRSVAARAWSGGLSLVVGGAWLEAGQWKPLLAELTDFLRAQADHLAYGYIRRGWLVDEALLDDSLPHDWPERERHQPHGIGFTKQAFDDVYAPDAFGVQLLGPGYAGRIPETARWRQGRVGTTSVILEHVDPRAWFDAPFVPFRDRSWRTEGRPAPPVLARARLELEPILYVPGVLSGIGYPDAEDR
jgi:hypothetical protein